MYTYIIFFKYIHIHIIDTYIHILTRTWVERRRVPVFARAQEEDVDRRIGAAC